MVVFCLGWNFGIVDRHDNGELAKLQGRYNQSGKNPANRMTIILKNIKMKMTTLFFVMLLPIGWAIAQQNEIIPNLSEVNDTTLWHLSDREIIGVDPIH